MPQIAVNLMLGILPKQSLRHVSSILEAWVYSVHLKDENHLPVIDPRPGG